MSQQIAEFYAKISADTTQIQASLAALNKKMEETKAKTQGAAGVFNSVKGSLASMVNPTTLAVGAVTALTGAVAGSYGDFQQYAGSIRDIALASGSTATEASLLVQVLDDFEISAGDVLTATKALTKNGLAPSLETMAALADQYVMIQDPMAKNEFLLKNLGKAGLQYANAMSQGGDALRDAAGEVNKSLILTDEQIEKAEKARLAVDSWADAWEGFKVSVGGAIGGLIATTATIEEQKKQFDELGLKTEYIGGRFDHVEVRFERFRKEMERGAAMTDFYSKQFPAATKNAEDAAAALELVSRNNAQLISDAVDIQATNDKYNESQAGILETIAKLKAEKEAMGKSEIEKLDEINEKIAEQENAYKKGAEEFGKAQGEKLAMMAVEMIAMSDGVAGFSEAEAAKAEAILATAGVAELAAFREARAFETATKALATGTMSLQEFDRIAKLMEKGYTIDVAIQINKQQLYDLQYELTHMTGGQAGKFSGTIGDDVPSGTNKPSGTTAPAETCFTGDTLVTLADRTTKPIRDIQVGDLVLSYDLIEDRTVIATVTKTIEHPANEGGRLLLINGYLKVTEEHLLWTGNEYKAAGDFVIGDTLVNLDGSHMRVVSVREIIKNKPTYNIHVDHDAHNYFAGGVLVHNIKQGWTGMTVGSFAVGGKGGGWGVVGDRQGGGWVEGVSELVYGNFKVFPSRKSKAMLKSGMFGRVPGFAFGTEDDGGVYSSSSAMTRVANKPKPQPGRTSDDSEFMTFTPSEDVAGEVAASVSAEIAVQMQAYLGSMNAAFTSMNDEIVRLGQIMMNENPRANGRFVADAITRSQV